MNKTLTGIMLAAFALAALPMSATALDPNADCRFNDIIGNTVVPPPPDAVVNWLPDCISIENGETVVWTNGDAVPVHAMELPARMNALGTATAAPNALNPGCLSTIAAATSVSLGALVVPEIDHDTLRFTYDAERDVLVVELEGARAAKATTAGGPDAPKTQRFECANEGPNGAIFAVEGDVLTLKYGCIFHHGGMTGTIRIAL